MEFPHAAMIYGSAWKGDSTSDLVLQALTAGFSSVDTAAESKNYREDLVGRGVRLYLKREHDIRDRIFLQTKFTPYEGVLDIHLPYDTTLSIADQVKACVRHSQCQLQISDGEIPTESDHFKPALDCVLLHFPMQSAIKTFQIWETLEGLVPSEIVHLGLSNVTPTILARIYERARIKPQAVQNRFCAENGYDIEVRAFCEAHGCEYQAYGVVTRCEELLEIAETVSLAEMARTSRVATVYFLLMNSLNVSVLNGTSNEAHISADIRDVKLLHEWISREENVNAWSNLSRGFHDHVTAVGIQWLRKQHYST